MTIGNYQRSSSTDLSAKVAHVGLQTYSCISQKPEVQAKSNFMWIIFWKNMTIEARSHDQIGFYALLKIFSRTKWPITFGLVTLGIWAHQNCSFKK